MNAVFFFYTITLIVICVITAAISIAAYASTRRQIFIYACGLFAVYAIEMCTIFFSEYTSQNITLSPSDFYSIDSACARTISAAFALQFMWLIILDIIDVHSGSVKCLPIVYFTIASFFIIIALPECAFTQFVYYTLRQVFLAGALLYTAYTYKMSNSPELKTRLLKLKSCFVVLTVLVFAITLEDAIMIFLVNPKSIGVLMPLYISNRNFSENILIVFSAAVTFTYSYRVLSIRIKETPQKKNGDLERHAADIIPFYKNEYDLSQRECEVLAELVLSKTNREIADKLFLAVGTVKTHVHNILSKTDKKNREELIEDFWRS